MIPKARKVLADSAGCRVPLRVRHAWLQAAPCSDQCMSRSIWIGSTGPHRIPGGVGKTICHHSSCYRGRYAGQGILHTDVRPITHLPGACEGSGCSSADKESQTRCEATSKSPQAWALAAASLSSLWFFIFQFLYSAVTDVTFEMYKSRAKTTQRENINCILAKYKRSTGHF